jgi:hypothetical protein
MKRDATTIQQQFHIAVEVYSFNSNTMIYLLYIKQGIGSVKRLEFDALPRKGE